MDVLLVIDMQEAPLSDPGKHDVPGVIARINRLAVRVRSRGGTVLFILHGGEASEGLAPGSAGWQLCSALDVKPADRRVHKRMNDAFAGTTLENELRELGAERVIAAGWATDFCVDSTVRSAVSRGFEVVVAADCHTLNDRPHLRAGQAILHHNWLWANLIADPPVRVIPEAAI